MRIQENAPLAAMTTFGLGGAARFFARVQSVDELTEAFAFAHEKNVPVVVLGGGSNVLVSDSGFAGLVIKIEMRGISVEPTDAEPAAAKGPTFAQGSPRSDLRPAAAGSALLIAAAGEPWDAIAARAVHENLWGIENLSGIPGTLGGAVVQNIGAYGAAISEVIEWVEVFDGTTGRTMCLKNAECAFDYRDSIFKHDAGDAKVRPSPNTPCSRSLEERPRYTVMRAALRLSKEPKPNFSYRDLRERFGSSVPALADIRAAVLDIRRGKFPDLSREGTAGSFFKNPLFSREAADKLKERYPDIPLFSMPETPLIKVPLAWLLDRVLTLRGTKMGGARLYERQPLVIAAERGTPAADVLALAEMVRSRVRNEFGFEIEEEVKILA